MATQLATGANYYELEAHAIDPTTGGQGTVRVQIWSTGESDSEVGHPPDQDVAEGVRDWFTTSYPGYQTVTLSLVGITSTPIA